MSILTNSLVRDWTLCRSGPVPSVKLNQMDLKHGPDLRARVRKRERRRDRFCRGPHPRVAVGLLALEMGDDTRLTEGSASTRLVDRGLRMRNTGVTLESSVCVGGIRLRHEHFRHSHFRLSHFLRQFKVIADAGDPAGHRFKCSNGPPLLILWRRQAGNFVPGVYDSRDRTAGRTSDAGSRGPAII